MRELVIAVYRNEADADAASRELESTGIPASSIRRYRPKTAPASIASAIKSTEDVTSDLKSSGPQPSAGGFWAWLTGEADAPRRASAWGARKDTDGGRCPVYDRYAASGYTIVTIPLMDDVHAARVTLILEKHDPADVTAQDVSASEDA